MDEKCAQHEQPLIYYCSTCQKSICSDCAMFGTDHRDHKFEHLEKVFERHLNDIRTEEDFIKQRLKDHIHSMGELKEAIECVQKAKDEKVEEINVIVHQMNGRLDACLKTKLMTLLAQKSIIADEIGYLESLEESINKEITKSNRSGLVGRSRELIKTIDEVKNRPPTSFNSSNVSIEFP